MSDPNEPFAEAVGSVAEEAGKLFSALQDWARDTGAGGAAGPAWAGMGEQLRNLNQHVATGGTECAYCPVCQVIHVVRQTSPEVKGHLAVAASSLLQAAAAVLDSRAAAADREPRVERIDLDEDEDAAGDAEAPDPPRRDHAWEVD